MTARERRLLAALQRLHTECRASVVKTIPQLPPSFARTVDRLGTLIQQVEAASVTLVGGGPFAVARARRDLLLKRLREEFLAPARKIARMHAATVPGFHTPFEVPKARTAVQAIVDTARRFADAAEPHVALFVENGMDDGFVQQIRTLAGELEAKHRETEACRAALRQTARDFRSLIREARRTAWLLDGIVRRRCAEIANTPLETKSAPDIAFSPTMAISKWERIFHVERDPVRKARKLEPQWEK